METDLLLIFWHFIPTLVYFQVDGVGLQLLVLGRKLAFQVPLDNGTGSLGVQEGGGQRAFGGIGIFFLLFALALLVGCSSARSSGGGTSTRSADNSLCNVVDGRGRGSHGGVGGISDILGQL